MLLYPANLNSVVVKSFSSTIFLWLGSSSSALASHAVPSRTPPFLNGQIAALWCRRGLTDGGHLAQVSWLGMTGILLPLSVTMLGQVSNLCVNCPQREQGLLLPLPLLKVLLLGYLFFFTLPVSTLPEFWVGLAEAP